MSQHVHPTFIEQAGYHIGCAGLHVWRALVAIWNIPTVAGILISAAIITLVCTLAGCSTFRRVPKINIPGIAGQSSPVSVQAPADLGKAATVDTSTEQAGIRIPKDSQVVVTKTEAVAATEKTPFQPATEVVTFKPSADTEWYQRAQKIAANTGTVDTSLAKHRIDAAENRWLLFAAIGCGVGFVVVKSMLPAWPALSNGLGVGAIIFFASWKFSEVPWWVALLVIGGVGLLALGYKRKEWDANGNMIPDVLEKK